jgi:poly(beta-D-mannuronate) lyase
VLVVSVVYLAVTRPASTSLPGGRACGPDLSAWNTAGVPYTPASGTLVRTAAELEGALADAERGGSITLADGTWENLVVSFGYAGSLEHPFVIAAQTPGRVRLVRPRIEISGRAIVLDGFLIEAGDAIPVKFRGPTGICSNCRLTNSMIMDATPASTRPRPFVSLFGHYNRVDHNYFIGGVMAHAVLFVETEAGQERYHRIDHNYIGERESQYLTWDGEAITIGSGPYQTPQGEWVHARQRVLVDENYICSVNSAFDPETREGGEEVISIKSSQNYIFHNTFDSNNVRHGITARFGEGNIIDSNYIFGGSRPESSGIALAGRHHVVRNNYIQDVSFAGITFFAGSRTPDPTRGYPVHHPAEDSIVEHNTLVNCEHCLLIGYNFGRVVNGVAFTSPPNGITFANDVISSPSEMLVTELVAPTRMTIRNSFFWGDALGFSQISPDNMPGLWVTAAPPLTEHFFLDTSISLPSEAGEGSVVDQGDRSRSLTYDIDRRCRTGIPDIGAHEYIRDGVPSVLTINDVGPITYDAAAIVYEHRNRPRCLFHGPASRRIRLERR